MLAQGGFLYLIVTKHKLTVQVSIQRLLSKLVWDSRHLMSSIFCKEGRSLTLSLLMNMFCRTQMENMDRMMGIQEERLGAELSRFSTIRDRIITGSKQVKECDWLTDILRPPIGAGRLLKVLSAVQ
jgi:hypothetical protein